MLWKKELKADIFSEKENKRINAANKEIVMTKVQLISIFDETTKSRASQFMQMIKE
jgi:hypothetical protein